MDDEVPLANRLTEELPGPRPIVHRTYTHGVPLAADPGKWWIGVLARRRPRGDC